MNRDGTTTVVVLSAGASPLLGDVLQAVLSQRRVPDVIRLIWSGSAAPPSAPRSVQLTVIPSSDFDHGFTRQLALELCDTDFMSFLSDDAPPAVNDWLSSILRPFVDPKVAAVYGRQLPRKGADFAEAVFREARYPNESRVLQGSSTTASALARMPISNANAAYRVTTLHSAGGFPRPCRFAEDRQLAERILSLGWKLFYDHTAAVYHSHKEAPLAVIRRGWVFGSRESTPSWKRFRGEIVAGLALAQDMVRIAWRRQRVRGVIRVARTVGLRAVSFIAGSVVSRLSPGASVSKEAQVVERA